MTHDDKAVRAGRYIGVNTGQGVVWRGIRYATAMRWARPTPAATPETDVLCDRIGPAIAQVKSAFSPAPSDVEDSLLLNIHSPAADGARRPVMVWVHGGAFLFGSGAEYDGSMLSSEGDIVVVTINYRLGVLGFGSFASLGVPRNLGLHDQIAAFQWVRANIAAFGGDPDRVTAAGESAGSLSLSALMVSAAKEQLFDRAILQSGALSLLHEAPFASRLEHRLRDILGPDAATLHALRRAPVQRLLSAQAQLGKEIKDALPAAPVFDGDLLPSSFQAARSVPTLKIPLLAGANREEIRLFELRALGGLLPTARPEIEARMKRQLGDISAARIGAMYAQAKPGNRDLGTDATFGMPTRLFAERHAAAGSPTWVYRFDRGGLMLGATHGAEMSYLWPSGGLPAMVIRGGPLIGNRLRLARRMRRCWIDFVRNGDPGADWPRYETSTRAVKLFDARDSIALDPDGGRRAAWAGHEIMAAQPIEA